MAEKSQKQTQKIIPQEQGRCPKCGGLRVTYEKPRFEGDYCVFPAKCDACGCSFSETFGLEYLKTTIQTD